MSSLVLQAHLDPKRKILDDPPAFHSWDRSYYCFQVRDALGVVDIDPVLKVSQQIVIWKGFKSCEYSDHCGSHTISHVIKFKLLFNLYTEICDQNSLH